MLESVMGSRNENGSFDYILLYIHLKILRRKHKFLILYEQIFFSKNECRMNSLEDMNKGAIQKRYIETGSRLLC